MTPARDPKQFFSTNLENHGKEIREEESWRRNHGASILGGIWEAFGKHLGSIWEASGTHLGGIHLRFSPWPKRCLFVVPCLSDGSLARFFVSVRPCGTPGPPFNTLLNPIGNIGHCWGSLWVPRDSLLESVASLWHFLAGHRRHRARPGRPFGTPGRPLGTPWTALGSNFAPPRKRFPKRLKKHNF